jgi:ribosomal protein L24E
MLYERRKPNMTEAKLERTVRRGRIFPEIQWTEEQHRSRKAERAAFRERCQVIFDRVKSEYLQTHYNWYIAVEPDSGEYFIDKDALVVAQIAHQKYPNALLHVFRINETGVCGTI